MNHAPRKRFGQNFLKDDLILQRMVAAIHPKPPEHLVEIGPGLGALTQGLLKEGVRLDAIELDRDLVTHLQRRFQGVEGFRLHSADALRFDFTPLMGESRLRVVGNLPYNISTPLIFHLLEQGPVIADMHFMLQREVVDRLCAEAGEGAYGRLSIMTRYYCRAIKLFEVPPESFDPPPKVMSAIVRLVPHERPPVEVDPKRLGRLVTAAFSQRRKTLRNALKGWCEVGALEAASIDPGARPETLSLKDYARILEVARPADQEA